jgi:hypothetical protein
MEKRTMTLVWAICGLTFGEEQPSTVVEEKP